MKKTFRTILCLFLICSLLISLTGCGNRTSTDIVEPASTKDESKTKLPDLMSGSIQPTSTPASCNSANNNVVEVTATAELQKSAVGSLSDTQRNSINMLNYLAVVTQEINASKSSRLYLEETYSTLLSNTDPSTVDEWTLAEYDSLLDTLEDYRRIAVKRDRLQFIYEQNQAQALRDAVPNPLGLLSAVRSFNLASVVSSVVYMAVDSITSYKSSSAAADLQFIQDGWELDDEESAVLHNRRKDTFSYMIRIVNDYGLPGYMALSENAVERYVERKSNLTDHNVVRTIQFLEDNVEVYQAFGDYWLTLADCYYRNGDYEKCLTAIATYEELGIQIFRADYSLARILPLAIIAAGEIYKENEYVTAAERFAKTIIDNTDYENDWALRYFAAQVFVDLYSRTGNTNYLQKAYEITKSNVTVLVEKQESLNEKYLAPVVLLQAPADATKEDAAAIEENNNQLTAYRSKELAPIYTPLLINCDLLLSLAEVLNISESELNRIESILRPTGAPIFLIPAIENIYQLKESKQMPTSNAYSVSFNGIELELPATLVTDDSTIFVTIFSGDDSEPFIIDDWKVSSVKRGTQDDINTFTATYISSTASKYSYSEGCQILITVTTKPDYSTEPIIFSYHTTASGDWYTVGITKTIHFERDTQ